MGPAANITVPLVKGELVVIDARRLSREAVRRLLEYWAFTVIGAGNSLADALADAPPDAKPDLIVYLFESDDEVERELPRIAVARSQFAGVKSVVLSDCTRTDVLLRAMRASVEAVLSKDISSDTLRRALELVLLGQHMFPRGLARMLLEPVAEPAPEARAVLPVPLLPLIPDRQRATTLSVREHEILRCLVDGLPNKAIARALDITEATVKVHIKGLLRKMNMSNRTQAAVWALNANLGGGPPLTENGSPAGNGPRAVLGGQWRTQARLADDVADPKPAGSTAKLMDAVRGG